jgi:magnesium transporter
MAESITLTPVEQLAEVVDSGNAEHLAMFLHLLAPEDTAYTIYALDAERTTRMLSLLATVDPDLAADLMEHFPDAHAADLIEELPPEDAAAIVDEMDSDEQTDVLSELDEEDAAAILEHMDPEEAIDARERLEYEPDTAGGLMITEFLSYEQDSDVDDVITDLRAHADEYGDYEIRYLYVTDANEKFVGVVTMRTLVMSPHGKLLTDLMVGNARTVEVNTPLTELEDLFDRVDYSAVPVVDAAGVLCGVVLRAAVQEALSERSTNDFLKFGGIIGGQELRSMPLNTRWVRRLAFLAPNILLSSAAVSIIGFYQGTIERLTVLAVFLPLVANLSGAAGNQSVAVSIRELALGLVLPRDVGRVIRQEVWVGLINGLAIGAVLAIIVRLFAHESLALAGVVGSSYILNSVLAVCLGGSLPLVLRRVGVDPAMMSSPILTTLTDMGSFLLTLTFAALAMGVIG